MTETEYETFNASEATRVLEQLKIEAEDESLPLVFVCEFDSTITPAAFVDAVFSGGDPFYTVGFEHQMSESEYYSVNGVAHPTEDCEAQTEITGEVCEDWMRLYVDDDIHVQRYDDFLQTVNTEYPFEITVASAHLDSSV